MRLLLVHGRAQGAKTEEGLLAEWQGALARGLEQAGRGPLPPSVEVRLPFYGKLLDELTAQRPGPGEVVTRGPAPGSADPLEGELVIELAHRAGVTDAEIQAEAGLETIERGPQNWEWVHAAARVLSRRVPWLGDRLLPVLTADVHAYLSRPHVTAAVDELVVDGLGPGPTVVVGHSLGSVVAYRVLRAHPDVDVPLFVTVGSPLGIDVVKRNLPIPLGMPRGVRAWLNAADERDYVALQARLDRDTFPADIENLSDVHNPRDHPHGIGGYLGDRIVVTRISQALEAAS